VVLEGGVILCPRHPQMPVIYKCTHCNEVMCNKVRACVATQRRPAAVPLPRFCSHKCERIETVKEVKKKNAHRFFAGYRQSPVPEPH